MEKTNSLQTLMHLLKTNIGTGVLAMPAAFLSAGLLVGTIGIPVMCVICTICVHQLIRANDHLCKKLGITKAMDYEEVAEKCCLVGPTSFRKYTRQVRLVVTFLLLVTQFGISCAYCIFVADNLRKVAIDWKIFDKTALADMSIHFYLLIICPFLIIINLVKSIKHLAIFSGCANVLQVIGLLIIGYNLVQDLPSLSSRPAVGSNVFIYLSIAVFAFEGIGVILPIYIPMKKPQQFTAAFGVLNVGMLIVAFCYFAIGFLGYLKYGKFVQGSITLNLPTHEPLYQAVRLMFAIAIFLTHPLALYVPLLIGWPKIRQQLEKHISEKRTKLFYLFEFLFRALMVILTVIIAASIPKVDLMISLVGASSTSAIALIFPPIFEIFAFWEEKSGFNFKMMVLRNTIIAVSGVLLAILGTYYSIDEIVKSFKHTSFKNQTLGVDD